MRPHFKAHKTVEIARRQTAAGGVGFCCATLSEAEVLADAGFDDLLIANEVVDPAKRDRLETLAERVPLAIAIDSPACVDFLAGLSIRVLIDVNVGMPRCGIAPERVVDLAKLAAGAGLHVSGVMGYEGHATVIEDVGKRADVTRTSMGTLLDVARSLSDEGFPVEIVSAGSTLTYDVTGTLDGITEIQAGSYVLMDTTFARSSPFEEALRLLTTLLSVNDNIAVLDGGLKALAVDHGNPELFDDTAADVLYLADEHTSLVTRDGFDSVVGDRVWLRPSHVDPTVNLHDRLYAFRGDVVEDVWPVTARGYTLP